MKDLKLNIIAQGFDKASKPFKNIIRTSGGLQKSLGKTARELKALNTTQKRLSGFANLKKQTSATSVALAKAQKEAQKLAAAYRNAEAPTKKMARASERAARQVKKLKTQEIAQRRELQSSRSALASAGVNIRKLGQAERETARQIAAVNTRLQTQQRRLESLNRVRRARAGLGTAAEGARNSGRRLVMGGAIAAAGVGGLFALVNSTAALGDRSAKTADKLGRSIEGLQELRYAAERTGGSSDRLDKSLEQLGKRTGEAAQGLGQARYAFEALGISLNDFMALDPDAQLGRLADELEGVASQQERLAIANQLFGRAGGDMINMLRGGSIALADLRQQARLTGFVLGEQATRDAEAFKDALLDSSLTLQGLKNTIGAELMPVFTSAMKSFSLWMQSNRNRVLDFATTFASNLRDALPAILNFGKGLGAALATIATVGGFLAGLVGGFDNLGIILAGIFVATQAVAFVSLTGSLIGLGIAAAGAVPAIISFAGAFATASALFLASPFGLVLGGIAAVAGAAFLIWKYWEPVSAFFQAVWQNIKMTFQGGLGSITAAILNWSPLGLFYRAFAGVLNWFGTDLPATFTGFGAAIVQGLIEGITGAWGWLVEKMSTMGELVSGAFQSVLGIQSPSRVFAELGGFVTQGLAQGIQGGQEHAVAAVSSLARALPRAVALGAVGTSIAAAPALAHQIQTPAIAAVPAYAGPSHPAVQGGDRVEIHVHGGPGIDARQLAHMVRLELDARDREKAARSRSALYD